MPSYRFWSMERNITRIMAEKDLRALNLQRAHHSDEASKDVIGSLTLELGETSQIERPKIIKASESDRQRMKHLAAGAI